MRATYSLSIFKFLFAKNNFACKRVINLLMHPRDFVHPYYLANLCILMAYPVSRAMKLLNFWYLDSKDELGLTRENTIFYTIIAFTLIKWFKRYSIAQFLSDIFYTIKVALITGYVLVDIRAAIAYASACLSVWLFFK